LSSGLFASLRQQHHQQKENGEEEEEEAMEAENTAVDEQNFSQRLEND
jgi:hypothetical protein